MTAAMHSRPRIFALLKQSWAEIFKHKTILLASIAIIFIVLTFTQTQSFAVIHFILVFFWLRIIFFDVTQGVQPTGKNAKLFMQGYWRFAFTLAGLIIFAALSALVTGVVCDAIVSKMVFHATDIKALTQKAMPWIFGPLIGLIVMMRFIFLLPTVAFGGKFSPTLAWVQSSRYLLTLLGGFFLTAVLLPVVILAVAIILPSSFSILSNALMAIAMVLSAFMVRIYSLCVLSRNREHRTGISTFFHRGQDNRRV